MPLRPIDDEIATPVRRFRSGAWRDDLDRVAVEEPMEMRLLWQDAGRSRSKAIAVTMRTPGQDFALALGFLFAEGVVAGFEDVVDISYCQDEGEEQRFNIVSITLRPGMGPNLERLERNFTTTSSCGVCGKASLEALEIQGCERLPGGFAVDAGVLTGLPHTLRAQQSLFTATGGLHAAGLFAGDGTLLALAEDIGRHNAVDKVIGTALLEGTRSLEDRVLMLSGRASFELLQKALMARIPIVAAVGAPSSLAVQVAAAFAITLAGFVQPDGFNVYAGAERIRG